MGSRLIFLRRLLALKRARTEKARGAGCRITQYLGVGVSHTIKRWGSYPRGLGQDRKVRVSDALLPRKVAREAGGLPYRKPTQVGEEKILRRLRELSLRNSANFHRNFGRRWAWERVGVYPRSASRSQRNGGSDCLPKTQDSAKSTRRRISEPILSAKLRTAQYTSCDLLDELESNLLSDSRRKSRANTLI